jgi:hypothetical protein
MSYSKLFGRTIAKARSASIHGSTSTDLRAGRRDARSPRGMHLHRSAGTSHLRFRGADASEQPGTLAKKDASMNYAAFSRTAWRALVLAIGLCGATAAGAVEVTEQHWGPRQAPLSWTPFFDAGAFRPQTMIDGIERYSYYDAQDHKFNGSDNVSRYAAGPQATQRGGLYTCGSVCDATAPGADAGYLAGAQAGGLHVAAGAWHLDHHPGDTSTGGAAFASAAVGDMLHLDHAATVHFEGYVEGLLDATGDNSIAIEHFDVLAYDPASVHMEGDDGLLADLYGGYVYTQREPGSGPGSIIDPPPGPPPRHYYDLAVDLPAGDSFISIVLESSVAARQGGAESNFADTATFGLLAPPDAHARFASGLIPLAIASVPEPGVAALLGCGLLVLTTWRRRG